MYCFQPKRKKGGRITPAAPQRKNCHSIYDDAVAETARLTEARPELDEQEQRAINERLAYIAAHIHEQPEVRIKYFVPDEHKSGGAIVEASGKVKKISATDGTIVLTDVFKIKTSDITNLSTLSIE